MTAHWVNWRNFVVITGTALGVIAVAVWWQFRTDVAVVQARVAEVSTLVEAPRGPIEYSGAGTGVPALAIHRSGGGYDQGMAFARGQLIGTVLATPPDLLDTASLSEQARINAMMENIFPVSARAAGLRHDTAAGKSMTPARLNLVRAPTLIISARDDRYGTCASAEYMASQIAGAKFLRFETGGHTWVGHHDEVMGAIADLILPTTGRTSP